jgi:hypothetical protein
MQLVEASHHSVTPETAQPAPVRPMPAGAGPTPMVGPLGGIVFSVLCLAAYVAVVVAVAMS